MSSSWIRYESLQVDRGEAFVRIDLGGNEKALARAEEKKETRREPRGGKSHREDGGITLRLERGAFPGVQLPD
jgi:hypothetical protein